MRKYVLSLVIFVLLLSGCQTATPEPVPTETTLPPTITAEPTLEPVAVVDYCVDCHTDKEQLIAAAKPEVEKEKESSGVG